MKCNMSHTPAGWTSGESADCTSLGSSIRIDGFPAVNLKIMQDVNAFCFGIDAVLLSDFAVVKKNERAADLGTGNGVIPLIIARKTGCTFCEFTALEIQKEQAELAEKNVILNGLEEKIKVVHGDIKNVKEIFESQSFDVVTSNPPYAVFTGGAVSVKTIARQEIFCSLEDVIKAASYILKPRGRFYMIHRPERLQQMMTFFSKYNLAAKKVRFVQPFSLKPPTMILVEAVKDAHCMTTVENPLVIYKEKGRYSEEVSALYKKLNG